MAKLSELKTLLAEAQKKVSTASQAAPSRRRPPRAGAAPRGDGLASDDVDLRQVFADVAPLTPANRARIPQVRPSPLALQRERDEANALLESKHGETPSPSSWEVGQELEAQQTFLRTGLGTDVVAKLRRGRWVVQGEIDLHRQTVDEAREAVAQFLLVARSRGWRCVRVIHGKGLSSPNREPILKGKVRRWLEQWDDVLAYCEAPRHSGGSGAVIVLLKSPVA
jgi:DNA-nicking Smr family endonuclease